VAAASSAEAYELGRKRLAQYFIYYPARLPVPMLPDDADIEAILRHRDQLISKQNRKGDD
jgi:hypothetical protein